MDVERLVTARYSNRTTDSAGGCLEDVNDHTAASAATLQALAWPMQSCGDPELSVQL